VKSALRLPVVELLDLREFKRVREIHTHACKHCPSAHYPPDEESLDYKGAPRQIQLEAVFRCAWRPDKACKGLCDFLEVSEQDLKEAPYVDD
jgi:hypothetical protein